MATRPRRLDAGHSKTVAPHANGEQADQGAAPHGAQATTVSTPDKVAGETPKQRDLDAAIDAVPLIFLADGSCLTVDDAFAAGHIDTATRDAIIAAQPSPEEQARNEQDMIETERLFDAGHRDAGHRDVLTVDHARRLPAWRATSRPAVTAGPCARQPRARERRERHVARSTSSADPGDPDLDPEPPGRLTAPIPRLGLSRDEAAAALGMSLDSFERHVQPSLPIVRLGRLRIVPVHALERWLDEHAERVIA